MSPMLRISTVLLWLSVAWSPAYGKAIPFSGSSQTHSQLEALIARQDAQLPQSACWSSCELSSGCGRGVCGLGSLLARRSDLASSVVANVSDENFGVDENPLQKRTFRYTSDKRDRPTRKRPTKAQSKEYVVPILNEAEDRDTYFGDLLPLFHERYGPNPDERAVSVQREFGDKPFQIGTNGLMGCTVVVLVSNTHVWMTHLWEAYSNGGDDSKSNKAFEDRVISFIKGIPVNNPATSPIFQNEPGRLKDEKKKNDIKPYIAPSGPHVDPNVFTGERGQRTSLHIMTPAVRDAASNESPARYANHVASIVDAIRVQMGGKRAHYRKSYNYVTLDPDGGRGGDARLMFDSTRGTALFQYDPDSDGRGKKAWRLWFEDEFTAVDLN